MAIWKENTATRLPPAPAPEITEPARFDSQPKPDFTPAPAMAPAPRPAAVARKESLIASDITIEGEGTSVQFMLIPSADGVSTLLARLGLGG